MESSGTQSGRESRQPNLFGYVKRFIHKFLGMFVIRAHISDPMHDSRTIANRLLTIARANGDSLTPMQLLKLVYIAHGWMLGLFGRPLIRDEVQAWQYGPVIPRLYNALKSYRGSPVTDLLAAPPGDALGSDETATISDVYELYASKSGPALSRLTHAPGTPWAMTYVPGEFGVAIPTDLIEDHYQRLANAD